MKQVETLNDGKIYLGQGDVQYLVVLELDFGSIHMIQMDDDLLAHLIPLQVIFTAVFEKGGGNDDWIAQNGRVLSR